jgi:hypothetical protein
MPHPPAKGDGPPSKTLRAFTAAEWKTTVNAARRLAAKYGQELAGVQIFMSGPVGYDSLFAGPDVFPALRQAAAGSAHGKLGISHGKFPNELRYLVHGNYMDSGAFQSTASGKFPSEPLPPRVRGARTHIASQMHGGLAFGCEGVIAHLPAEPPEAVSAVAADVVERAIKKITAGPPAHFPEHAAAVTRLYLETSARAGREWIYGTAPQLKALVESLNDRGLIEGQLAQTRGGGPVRVGAGVCVDTAHVWAQGGDPVVTYADAEELLRPAREAADGKLPLEVHLNDNELAYGAGRDVHASLYSGKIWRGDDGDVPFWESSIAGMLDIAQECGGLAVLERGKNSTVADDYAVLARAGYGRGGKAN